MSPFRIVTMAAAVILAAQLVTACEMLEEHPRQVIAPVTGAAVGVSAGEAIGATAAEAGLGAAGAIVGLAAGPYLERRDVVFRDKAIDIAAEAEPGKPVRWANPNTGTSGTLTREDDVDVATDLTCRRLRSEEKTDTEIEVETMVVCRPDLGTWYIRSSWLLERKPLK